MNMAFIRENRESSFSPQFTGVIIVLIENITHMLPIKILQIKNKVPVIVSYR